MLGVTCETKAVAFEFFCMWSLTVDANQHLQMKYVWSMIWRQKYFAAVHAYAVFLNKLIHFPENRATA